MDDIVTILNDESNQRSDVSFHFRIPGNAYAYIECSVGGPVRTGPGTGTGGAADTNANRMEEGLHVGTPQIEVSTGASAAAGSSSAQPAAASSATSSTSSFSSLAGSYAAREGTT